MDPSLLSRAIVVWTGWGQAPWPDRDESRVVAEFGAEQAIDLLPKLIELEADFYESDAAHTVPDLQDMGDRAAADFRCRHPEISEDAVQAFAWCYTFHWK